MLCLLHAQDSDICFSDADVFSTHCHPEKGQIKTERIATEFSIPDCTFAFRFSAQVSRLCSDHAPCSAGKLHFPHQAPSQSKHLLSAARR